MISARMDFFVISLRHDRLYLAFLHSTKPRISWNRFLSIVVREEAARFALISDRLDFFPAVSKRLALHFTQDLLRPKQVLRRLDTPVLQACQGLFTGMGTNAAGSFKERKIAYSP